MEIESFIKNNPRFSVATNYYKNSDSFSTVVSYYNYYQEIFSAQETPVVLHFFVFGANGKQIAYHSQKLDSAEFIQKNLRDLCGTKTNEGIVGVAATPSFDLEKIAQGKIPLLPKISTGFYTTWFDNKNHVDIMHEWNAVSINDNKEKKSYLSYEYQDGKIRPFAILMNTSLGNCDLVTAKPKLELYVSNKGKANVLSSCNLDPIPAMGTRVVDIFETLSQAEKLFQTHKILGLLVTSKNLPLPLTLEIHECGDFHIHHG
jgi:hypothetical protein